MPQEKKKTFLVALLKRIRKNCNVVDFVLVVVVFAVVV